MRSSIIAFLIASAPAVPALANACDGLGDLLDFIADQSGHALPAECPIIIRSAQLSGVGALRSQVGAFVPSTGQILLAPDLDTDSVLGRSYLLHELVHAAQYHAGAETRVRCEGELEREAYRVQSAWLRQQGEMREALLIDWVADTLGRCPTDPPAADY
jgi:hypothetical protein